MSVGFVSSLLYTLPCGLGPLLLLKIAIAIKMGVRPKGVPLGGGEYGRGNAPSRGLTCLNLAIAFFNEG